MRNYVTYITYYKGTKLPPFYIGSSYEEKVLNGYNGSVSSKKWVTVYKEEQANNKHLFKTKILSYHGTPNEALTEELRLQKLHTVVTNNNYFNESYAQPEGYFGRDVSGKSNPNYGRKYNQTDEGKQNISAGNHLRSKTYKEVYSKEKANELVELRKEHFKKVAPKGRYGLDNNSGKCYYINFNNNERLFTSRKDISNFCKENQLSFNLLFTNLNNPITNVTTTKQKSVNCLGLCLYEVTRVKI